MHIIDQSENDYLFILAKNTNTTYPNSNYIDEQTFPEQMEDLLGTEVELRYRLKNFFSSSDDDHIFNRPSDDVNYTDVEHISPPDDMFYYKTDKFIVLRADNAEPYVMIAKHRTKDLYFINSTRLDENNEYDFKTKVSLSSEQMQEFKNITFIDIYDNAEYSGEVYRIDNGEEFIIIIKESIGESDYRYLLGTEVISVIDKDSNVEE